MALEKREYNYDKLSKLSKLVDISACLSFSDKLNRNDFPAFLAPISTTTPMQYGAFNVVKRSILAPKTVHFVRQYCPF